MPGPPATLSISTSAPPASSNPSVRLTLPHTSALSPASLAAAAPVPFTRAMLPTDSSTAGPNSDLMSSARAQSSLVSSPATPSPTSLSPSIEQVLRQCHQDEMDRHAALRAAEDARLDALRQAHAQQLQAVHDSFASQLRQLSLEADEQQLAAADRYDKHSRELHARSEADRRADQEL